MGTFVLRTRYFFYCNPRRGLPISTAVRSSPMTFADGKSFAQLLFAPAEAPEIEEPPTDTDNYPSEPVENPDDFEILPDDEDEEVNPVSYSAYATSAYDDFIVWQKPVPS